MTEILTESFCERCGTRYTFESAAPRKSRIGRVKVVSRGLRNYVLQDESSLSEALADARSEEERAATSYQLDAFHKTFNFCMTCRQYTCGNCWNDVESRCLTCSPLPEAETPVVHAADLPATPPIVVVGATETGTDPESWPDADLAPDRVARAIGAPETEPDAPSAPSPARGVAPGQSIEDAVAQYEAQLAAEEDAELEAELMAGSDALDEVTLSDGWSSASTGAIRPIAATAAEPEPEPVVAAEPEPVVAAEPEPEPVVAAEPEPEPVVAAEPEPEPVVAAEPAAAGRDVIEQPTWPVQPTTEPAPVSLPEPAAPAANPWLTVAPDDGSPEPQWPLAPTWARTARQDGPTTLAGRQLAPNDNAAALWAASAREVLSGSSSGSNGPLAPAAAPAPATPQPCVQCGLSLSANAKFCRRCGTRQG